MFFFCRRWDCGVEFRRTAAAAHHVLNRVATAVICIPKSCWLKHTVINIHLFISKNGLQGRKTTSAMSAWSFAFFACLVVFTFFNTCRLCYWIVLLMPNGRLIYLLTQWFLFCCAFSLLEQIYTMPFARKSMPAEYFWSKRLMPNSTEFLCSIEQQENSCLIYLCWDNSPCNIFGHIEPKNWLNLFVMNISNHLP